jgi:hypothetical protein
VGVDRETGGPRVDRYFGTFFRLCVLIFLFVQFLSSSSPPIIPTPRRRRRRRRGRCYLLVCYFFFSV